MLQPRPLVQETTRYLPLMETCFGQSGFHGLTVDGIADQCTHHRYTIIASSRMQVNMPVF